MKRVCLGKIVSAHGIKGLVKILPFGEDPLLIEELSPLFTGENSSDQLSITMKNSAGNKYWLAAVDGITERNGAEALRGTELWVDRDSLPEIESKNTYYHTDLIGLKAVLKDGTDIGEIIDVKNFGAGDLLEIKPSNAESFYIPFTNQYVQKPDFETGILIITEIIKY